MYWFDEGEKMVREKVILHTFLYKKGGYFTQYMALFEM